MDNLRANYRDEEEDDESRNRNQLLSTTTTTTTTTTETTIIVTETITSPDEDHHNSPIQIKEEPEDIFYSEAEEIISEEENDEEEEEEEEEDPSQQTQTPNQISSKPSSVSDEDDETPKRKKQKSLSSFVSQTPVATPISDPESPKVSEAMPETPATDTPLTVAVEEEVAEEVVVVGSTALKKTKKKPSKGNCVWTKPTSRKGKKKSKPSANHVPVEDTVLITPVPRFFDKSDDAPDTKICLSKVYKAEKVELSEDRLSAGSTKGYRMVRATRGVSEGAWYFEIKVVKLGETGHTRLGWSTEKGDLQAPVGYDGNSFGYRDVDGSKVHKAMREKYGEEGYVEGDIIGFYINLPEGSLYAPKPPHLVWYKGQRFACAPDGKEESPKVIPGSEISFFRNGVCQGVAFKDLFGGRYYPAASMYTLPNQPNCMVKFNFGPDFELFPQEFEGRTIPKPMIEAPYHGLDSKFENGESTEKKQ